jgi:3-methyl-2-oxobutanoate hydroxymethyltransferase
MAKITAHDIVKLKADGVPIVCLTAYDFPTAAAVEEGGVDLILVGDSLGMVVQGADNTLGVTLDEMAYHVRLVKRAASRALVVADMPFMSFQESDAATMAAVGKLVKEAGAEAVKLEGARPETLARIRLIIGAGVPVMGHVGYTPQSTHYFGRRRVQGKTAAAARALVVDAVALEEAGCFAVVLELVPRELAAMISRGLTVPTVGIGSGPGCDGQILVLHDLVGFYRGYSPKFVRRLANVNAVMTEAVREYGRLVRAGEYPAAAESVALDARTLAELEAERRPGD